MHVAAGTGFQPTQHCMWQFILAVHYTEMNAHVTCAINDKISKTSGQSTEVDT
jgi:hypothetical protein